MSTLLMRFSAPLQSWGADSKFENRRETKREPTKSGVVGLLAAALGRRREDPIDDLAALRFGVRIDQPGQLLQDYHIIRVKGKKDADVTTRNYLADAVFLVGLEGDGALLELLDSALNEPVFPLYLGRRCCPPTGRISLGVLEKPLEESLRDAPWLAGRRRREEYISPNNPIRLTTVTDDTDAGFARRRDHPVSFSQRHRRYEYRYLVDKPDAVTLKHLFETEHDAFEELDDE